MRFHAAGSGWGIQPQPLVGIQHVLLSEVGARAGEVGHIAARDQQRVRTEADPPVSTHVPSPPGALIRLHAQPAPISSSHFSQRSVLISQNPTREPGWQRLPARNGRTPGRGWCTATSRSGRRPHRQRRSCSRRVPVPAHCLDLRQQVRTVTAQLARSLTRSRVDAVTRHLSRLNAGHHRGPEQPEQRSRGNADKRPQLPDNSRYAQFAWATISQARAQAPRGRADLADRNTATGEAVISGMDLAPRNGPHPMTSHRFGARTIYM
jgi:hypothetical protein